jgi:hypothetical protein
VCITPSTPLKASDRAQGLSPRVARPVRWFPEDTETLIVARSVTLPARPPDKPQDANWLDLGVGLATGDLFLADDGRAWNLPNGRKIECIVSGAKNFGAVGTPGSLCRESCAINVFEKELADAARQWADVLHKRATAVLTSVGREVFVFPPLTARCPALDLVLLSPDTVLCAYAKPVPLSSDEMRH